MFNSRSVLLSSAVTSSIAFRALQAAEYAGSPGFQPAESIRVVSFRR